LKAISRADVFDVAFTTNACILSSPPALIRCDALKVCSSAEIIEADGEAQLDLYLY